MVLFFIICIIFFIMLLMPIYIGMKTAQNKSEPMVIQESNTRDPRYFALSFQKLIDKAWKSYDGSGILKMSKAEEVIETDKTELSTNAICNSLVYAENYDFTPKEGIIFEKEIYVKGNARLEKIPLVRAIACMSNLVLGDGTRIIRWADAVGTLTAHNNCDLGYSTTSATKLVIGKNCSFKRLYAPEIWIGHNDGEFDSCKSMTIPEEVIISSEILCDIKYVDDEIVNKNGILRNTIITEHDITVLENFEVQGHITSHSDVKICSNAIVHGNVFAEGNIFIGNNAIVLGVVFTQENIYVDNGAIIGQSNKIKSVVARGNIEFGSSCKVYGYIGAERSGKICSEF